MVVWEQPLLVLPALHPVQQASLRAAAVVWEQPLLVLPAPRPAQQASLRVVAALVWERRLLVLPAYQPAFRVAGSLFRLPLYGPPALEAGLDL